MINIYLGNHQLALKYLKNTEGNIYNILVLTGDFNIRDSNWDSLYSHHLAYSDILMEIADSLKLGLSSPVHQLPTQYVDNVNNYYSVIDLMFLWPDSVEFNNYFILPESWYLLDHTPLTIDISISKEFIQDRW